MRFRFLHAATLAYGRAVGRFLAPSLPAPRQAAQISETGRR